MYVKPFWTRFSATSIPRGVRGGQEEAFNPSRGVSGRARVVLGVKVFGL
jgi:hypothetical protein